MAPLTLPLKGHPEQRRRSRTGTGAVFALVAHLVEPARVGAAGGLGGFFPPLVMGAVYGSVGDYSLGYVLLAVTAAFAGVLSATVVQRRVRQRPSGSTPFQ